MDDELWDVRFCLDGLDNVERSIGISDITYMNLLAVIEREGYGINDYMYYVKEKGRGIAGMELVDGMAKVNQMVEQYEDEKCVSLTVTKRGNKLPAGINSFLVEEQIPISEFGVEQIYTVDDDGVLFPSQELVQPSEECVQLTEDSEYMYLLTQQSQNVQTNKGKGIMEDDGMEYYEDQAEEHGDSDDLAEGSEDFDMDMAEYEPAETQLENRKRKHAGHLSDGESDYDDLFDESDDSSNDSGCEIINVPDPEPAKKKKLQVKRPGERTFPILIGFGVNDNSHYGLIVCMISS